MPSFKSLFRKKEPKNDQDERNNVEDTKMSPIPTDSTQDPASATDKLTTYAPGTGPTAHTQMNQANNIGMLGGAALGSATGGDPIMGMVEGQVVGNMIMQRVQQERKHQYFKGEAMNYREGLKDGKKEGSEEQDEAESGEKTRKEKRDDKRKERWERRAKRRDGEVE